MIHLDEIVATTCPYCGVGCNLELDIKRVGLASCPLDTFQQMR